MNKGLVMIDTSNKYHILNMKYVVIIFIFFLQGLEDEDAS